MNPSIRRSFAMFAAALLTACAPAADEARSPEVGPEAVSAAGAFEGISEGLATGSSSIDAAGLVAAYDMETTTADGHLRDFSGNGHHGSFETAAPEAGVHGVARLYRTVQDRVFLESDPQFDVDGPLTVAVWVRVDEVGLHQHIFACDDKWALWITPDDRYRLGDTRGGGWSSAPGRAREGEWASVVVVLRGTRDDPLNSDNVSLYVDGDLADAGMHLRTEEAQELGLWNPGELYPSDACYIGFESHQGMESHKTMPFVGAIDEVMLFARAWSEDEVRAFSARR